VLGTSGGSDDKLVVERYRTMLRYTAITVQAPVFEVGGRGVRSGISLERVRYRRMLAVR
jgi:hypothetical protein